MSGMETKTVIHHGRTTAYRIGHGAAVGETGTAEDAGEPDGPGAPICYVHGSGATADVWAAQLGPRGPAHPAVAVDLSGHGESEDVDVEPGPETLDAYVEDVAAVVESTGARTLVGNSMGGAVLLQGILDGALDPDALVLAGTGAKLTVAEELLEALEEDFEAVLDLLHEPGMLQNDPTPESIAGSRAALQTTGQAVTRRDFLSCHTFDVRERLDEIRVPTLAVVGEADVLTPPEYHEFLAAKIPNARLATIADAAHVSMVDRPVAFDDVVRDFLADVAADQGP